jgi:uncharacterized protein
MASIFRRILAVAFLIGMVHTVPASAEPPIPALTGRVVDQAGILDQATVAAITGQTEGYEKATGKQLVVVTLADLQNYPIEDWGLALGRGWGIGQKGKNNGVLLIVAPNDRELRIEVGYGLEGDLPDATANTIIQSEIIPHFKRGDMKGGVRAGVTAILEALGGNYTPTQIVASPTSDFPVGPFKVFALIFIAFVLIGITRDRGSGTGGGGRRGSSGWSSGGSSSGGRSSGGFSGGGGSFGGGGASGRW